MPGLLEYARAARSGTGNAVEWSRQSRERARWAKYRSAQARQTAAQTRARAHDVTQRARRSLGISAPAVPPERLALAEQTLLHAIRSIDRLLASVATVPEEVEP